MKIEINIEKEDVYRSFSFPHQLDFTDIRRDVNSAMDKVERALMTEGVTQVSVKIMNYGEEVGTLSASLE